MLTRDELEIMLEIHNGEYEMPIDREKEIKKLMYLKSELIKQYKRELHNLKMELEELNKQKTLERKRRKWKK